MNKKELKKLTNEIPLAQWKFEMAVECSALEVIEIAKDISNTIGEISVFEAKQAIIREFIERLMK